MDSKRENERIQGMTEKAIPDKITSSRIKKLISKARARRNAAILSVCLALSVVVLVMARLILPAVTLSDKSLLDCPYEIHQHDESCYQEVPVYDDKGTQTGTEKVLICGKADYVIHQHDENCYQDGLLVCALPEYAEHIHTEECYQEQTVLICDKQEGELDENGEPHIHDDSCYETQSIITCGQQELHHHTKKCYDKDGNLICGLLELSEHQHTSKCIKEIPEQKTEEETADGNENSSHVDEGPDETVVPDESGQEDISLQDQSEAKQGSKDNAEENKSEDSTDVSVDEAETDADSATDNQKEEKVKDSNESSDQAQTFDDKSKGTYGTVTVHVEAPEGAFAEGTTMKVTSVEDETTIETIKDTVQDDDQIDGTIQKVQAVDITFFDKEGKEVEPAVPISVSMSSSLVKKAKKDDDTEITAVHVSSDGQGDIITPEDENDNNNSDSTLIFEADSFSVYALVTYTVDFHWEVDGKKYDFSIPGGGFVSLEHMVELLGIASADENGKIEAESGENSSENSSDSLEELSGVAESGENDTVYDKAIKLNESEVSEATKKFVADVESVEFSSPELVWVGKVDISSTVGGLKETNRLEVEYSADLTKEQIAEINVQTVEAEDWALIGLKPFTSKENLIVTMKNGDQFEVKVTDVQVGSTGDIDGSKAYVIYTEINGTYYVLKTDGTTYQVTNRSDLDALTNEYKWQFTYVYTDGNNVPYYNIHPSTDQYQTLALNWILQSLVQTGNNNINITPYGDSNGGYIFGGYNGVVLHNDIWGSFDGVIGSLLTPASRIMIYEQEQLNRYVFTVSSDDYSMGYVSGKNVEGANVDNQAEFDSRTNAQKVNNGKIVATPQSDKYLFDYWDLNGTRLDYGDTIKNNALTIPYQGSKLTAHFKRNPNWQASDDEKEGRIIDKESLREWLDELKGRNIPLDNNGCNKTAELYDYENRIYRVDLTAQSNLTMFNGSIDMGFIMDVSGSMQFPSKLTEATGTSGQNLSDINISLINQWDSSNNQYYWQTWGLDHSKNYYVIAEKSTKATVFRVNYHTDDNRWHRVDGSFYPGDGVYNATRDALITTTQTFYSDPAGTHYQLYVDGDAPNRRLHYLETSMNGTINEMQDILGLFAIADDPSDNQGVSVAWNTFCATVTHSQHQFLPVLTSPPIFAWDTDGGTRTDRALADAVNFNWGDSNTKYAVLITDGAPQTGSNDSETQDQILSSVRSYAQQLRDQGITLITVGLSMKDVKIGSVLLYDIASKDGNGDPYFYNAQSGDELQYILYEILQKAMGEAIVEGNVTDTVNEAFYPVDRTTGKPLENGDKIDLEGNLITGSPTGAYGVIKESGGTYTVEWKNQEFTWDGWHGTFYQKAKEDFLGGNAVRTNSGQAVIESTGYKMKPGDPEIEFNDATKVKGKKTLDTPRVNVNELNLLENNTEWTVYLGTEVNPREQLEELYKNILVEEVVNSAVDTNSDGLKDKVQYEPGNNHYRFSIEESSSDQRTPGESRVTFPLKDVVSLTSDQWDAIIEQSQKEGDENKGLTITYDKYGQDCPGTVNIKLVKNHDPAKHTTDATGTPVETYTLTVVFSPDYVHVPAGQGGDPEQAKEYHTGTFGLGYQGHAAGTDTSTNEHKINVFAKKLQIMKADQSGNIITSDSAAFVLYRKATEEELAKDSVTKTDLTGVDGKYVAVQTLTTSEGTVTTDKLPLLADNEPYYLVETKAPAGYIMLTEPLKVTIDMSDNNTWTKLADVTTSPVKPNPYVLSNWLQKASIKLLKLDDTAYDPSHTLTYNSNNDTTGASEQYKIFNNAGVELPSTGGSGTRLFTILGSILIFSSALLYIRQRRRV